MLNYTSETAQVISHTSINGHYHKAHTGMRDQFKLVCRYYVHMTYVWHHWMRATPQSWAYTPEIPHQIWVIQTFLKQLAEHVAIVGGYSQIANPTNCSGARPGHCPQPATRFLDTIPRPVLC